MASMAHMDAVLTQLVEQVRTAYATVTPLRIIGGGSKDFLGLPCQGQPLDVRPWCGIVSYEPSELVITVRAGTPLHEVQSALAACGQYVPFDPPQWTAHSTIGGVIASGLSGPGRASVGAVRDYVLGVELINGRGELLRFGGQVMKNVAGYDVARLMAGSWGTLGVLTEVSLKVLPVALGQATLYWDGIDQAQALQQLHAWGGQPLPLNASCWVAERGRGRLYVRLQGAVAAVEAACRSLGGRRVAQEAAVALWCELRDHRHAWFEARGNDQCLWRLSVPPTAPVLALPTQLADPLVEWHGALRWVQAPRSVGPQLQALAQAVGGSAWLFRPEAACTITGTPLLAPQPGAMQRIHAQLQQAFDPAGILNPGRVMA